MDMQDVPRTSEYLVRISVDVAAVPPSDLAGLLEAEGEMARAYQADGTIHRIWRLPGQTASIGVWHAPDATRLHERLSRLPLFRWSQVSVTALSTHYLEE